VLENIKYIASTDIWLEITTLVIPGKNDSMEELSKIAEFIKSINPNIPWHISAFHGMYKMKGIHSTSSNTLSQIYKL
jgi:pyruvate formate lyase activating enzyme